MIVTCQCGKKLNVSEQQVGKRGECPNCHLKILIQPDKERNADTYSLAPTTEERLSPKTPIAAGNKRAVQAGIDGEETSSDVSLTTKSDLTDMTFPAEGMSKWWPFLLALAVFFLLGLILKSIYGNQDPPFFVRWLAGVLLVVGLVIAPVTTTSKLTFDRDKQNKLIAVVEHSIFCVAYRTDTFENLKSIHQKNDHLKPLGIIACTLLDTVECFGGIILLFFMLAAAVALTASVIGLVLWVFFIGSPFGPVLLRTPIPILKPNIFRNEGRADARSLWLHGQQGEKLWISAGDKKEMRKLSTKIAKVTNLKVTRSKS